MSFPGGKPNMKVYLGQILESRCKAHLCNHLRNTKLSAQTFVMACMLCVCVIIVQHIPNLCQLSSWNVLGYTEFQIRQQENFPDTAPKSLISIYLQRAQVFSKTCSCLV